MLWYQHRGTRWDSAFNTDCKVFVLAESPATVMETLLVRPSDREAQWVEQPHQLDLSNMGELTLQGTLHNVLSPYRTPNGYWGLTFGDGDSDHRGNVASLTQQLNASPEALAQLVGDGSGTLLWVSWYGRSSAHPELRNCWAVAPAAGLLEALAADGVAPEDPAVITMKLMDPLYPSDLQPLAIGKREHFGFATRRDAATLDTCLQRVATTHAPVSN